METTQTTASAIVKATNFLKVPFAVLDLYPNNPRKDLGDIKGLAAMIIGANAVIKPLSGFKKDGVYLVVDGSRRFAALKLLQEKGGHDEILNAIPFEVLTDGISEVDLAFKQMASNEGEPLKPLELAEQIKILAVDWELKTSDIADRIGKSKVYVNEMKRLADLPNHIKKLINNGTISATLVRQHMKANTLEEFVTNLGGEELEAGEEVEGVQVGKKVAAKKQAKVTAKDASGINSIKDFKRFAKAFTEVFPNSELEKAYTLLTMVVNNEIDYNGFLDYFTDEKTRATAIKADEPKASKADKQAGLKKAAPKKAAAKKEAAKKAAPKKATSELAKATAAAKKSSKTGEKATAKATASTKGAKATDEAKTKGKTTGRVIGFDKTSGKANV